jgi:hypothetical protein
MRKKNFWLSGNGVSVPQVGGLTVTVKLQAPASSPSKSFKCHKFSIKVHSIVLLAACGLWLVLNCYG